MLIRHTGELKVIVYGLGNTVWDAIDYIRTRFLVVGCSDSDLSKSGLAERIGAPFISSDALAYAECDYILIVSVYDEEIWKQLIDNGVEQEKILKRKQWDSMLFYHCYGERNPDKTFYILSHPIHLRDGLFSFLFAFLEQIDIVEKNGYIPVVDMKNYKNQYMEKGRLGLENVWEYYYEPISSYTLEEAYKSKNVILGYDDNCYKANYDKKYNISRMSELYQRYIRYQPNIIRLVEEEFACRINPDKRTLGVLYRGTDMSSLKLRNHPIQPTVEEMIPLIYRYMDKWKCERIFLSTEDACAAEKFKAEFGSVLSCTDQKRFGDTGEKWLSHIEFDRKNDKYLRGLEYLITIELLSRCNSLLAGVCTGSICAQIINNGKYEHIKMVDKGEYI